MSEAPIKKSSLEPPVYQSTATAWLDGPLGQRLLAQEQRLVEHELQQIFGFQLLQVGAWGAPNHFVQYSKTLRSSVLAHERDATAHPDIDFVGLPTALPVASDSVDAVILPHTLELHEHPHQILREVQRVLVGEGQLIILGFSPISLWGLRQHGMMGLRLAPKQPVFTQHRICDWLRLLGLDPIQHQHYFYSPPIEHEGFLRKTSALENWGGRCWPFLNGAYLLRAKKSLLRAATVGPRWHRRRSVVGGLADVATRNADNVAKQPE